MDLRIKTPRLTLIPGTLALAEASGGTSAYLESLIGGVAIDTRWLEEDGRGLLSFYAYQLREDPAMIGFGMWLIILESEQRVIGSGGFKGRPDKRGCIEIGYGISPNYRRRGYTFEAATGLIRWGFAHDEVERITAECLPNNAGSKRILEKLGMTNLGLQGMYIKWALERQAYAAAH